MASLHPANVNIPRDESMSNITKTMNTEPTRELLTVIQITCYSIIIVIGTIGNLMLIFDLVTKHHLKTSQYFILNLAIVDLLTCTLSIPFDISLLVVGDWPFGPVMCRVVYPLQTILMAVSVFTLLCMAVERYRAILHPLKPKIHGRVIILVILLNWAIATGLVSPYAAALMMKNGRCAENWPNNDPRYPKAFSLCVFLILYLSPLCIITAAYACVGIRLRANSHKTELLVGTIDCKSRLAKSRTQRNIRIVKFFVLAVAAFALCLLPFQVMWMWSDFGNGQDWSHFNEVLTFANVMVYANSAVNPYIFGALGRRYNSCNCLRRKIPKERYFARNTFPFHGFVAKRRSAAGNKKLLKSPEINSIKRNSPNPEENRSREKNNPTRTLFESSV
ncbi:neuropeptide FF receptor 2-like [Stylophora pistillata]|uniref:neuropeptide FF receptor 2-like n=1 Tax=Stylophora pistillata TaxID=50429 RepID=UPI000C040199|nr:neuropeptide FF receptor 2-like [Stylophora pistillata]